MLYTYILYTYAIYIYTIYICYIHIYCKHIYYVLQGDFIVFKFDSINLNHESASPNNKKTRKKIIR